LDGRFVFLNGGVILPRTTVKGFAYLLDYDTTAFINQPTLRGQLDPSKPSGSARSVRCRWGRIWALR
jgi:hypothetical protein